MSHIQNSIVFLCFLGLPACPVAGLTISSPFQFYILDRTFTGMQPGFYTGDGTLDAVEISLNFDAGVALGIIWPDDISDDLDPVNVTLTMPLTLETPGGDLEFIVTGQESVTFYPNTTGVAEEYFFQVVGSAMVPMSMNAFLVDDPDEMLEYRIRTRIYEGTVGPLPMGTQIPTFRMAFEATIGTDYQFTPFPPMSVEYEWDNIAGGDFATDSNWYPLGVPTSIDSVEFGLPIDYTVSFSDDEESKDVRVSEGIVTFDLLGTNYNVESLRVRRAGGGGSLTIVHGTVTVAEAAPLLVGVGPSPNDDITVMNGGSLILNHNVRLGGESGLADSVTVLSLGTAQFDGIEIVSSADAEADLFVSGSNSNADIYGDIVVGNATALSSVRVGAGGAVTVFSDGDTRVNRGTVTVTGIGGPAEWNNSSGELDLVEGRFEVTGSQGSATFENARVVGAGSGTVTAIVQLDAGATMTVNDKLTIGSVGGASFDAVNLVDSQTILNVGTWMRIEENGLLGGVGTVNAPTIVNFGSISPGLSPGELILNGNYEQEISGRLVLEIAGTDAGVEYDVLTVTGDVTIEGTVVLKFIDGFSPQMDQQFELLNVTGLVDLSSTLFEVQNLAPGFQFDVSPSANGVVMTALNDGQFAILGDYNDDGVVNAADYVTWRDNLGSPESLPNDATPGVTAGDYDVWRANFGGPPGASLGTNTAVPEPGNIALLGLGLGLLLGLRPRCNNRTVPPYASTRSSLSWPLKGDETSSPLLRPCRTSRQEINRPSFRMRACHWLALAIRNVGST